MKNSYLAYLYLQFVLACLAVFAAARPDHLHPPFSSAVASPYSYGYGGAYPYSSYAYGGYKPTAYSAYSTGYPYVNSYNTQYGYTGYPGYATAYSSGIVKPLAYTGYGYNGYNYPAVY